jgi:hypothetical protein
MVSCCKRIVRVVQQVERHVKDFAFTSALFQIFESWN